jgi:predicted flap endonuclease-1-like 5' DNA nuclease
VCGERGPARIQTGRTGTGTTQLSFNVTQRNDMANQKIQDIEGIGPAIGDKLRAAGVTDTDTLLAKSGTPAARKTLAGLSGLSEAQVLKFANMADLYRVKGVGSEFAELLEAAGVDTVPALARRNAANLAEALAKTNEEKKLTRRVPTEKEVAVWIESAKALPRALQY